MTPLDPTLADEAEEKWLANTRRLLVVARQERSETALTRAKIRVDSERFSRLPSDTQHDLLTMYAQAMWANGAMFP